MHDVPFISTIAVGLGLACILAVVAHRLRLPLIAGYLVAGVIIGPFTPGFVADQNVAAELAEMGVILLMFGVGLHFSVGDLMAVRRIAVPGAIGRIVATTAVVVAMTSFMGWTIGAGIIFGLSLSVASTVVLLRTLQENDLMASEAGKIAIGWLIVEDLVMVFALVLVPPLAGLLGGDAQPVDDGAAAVARLGVSDITATLLITTAKVAAFVALMLIVGARFIPLILHYTATTGQRELFRLSVLALALGVAYASATVFGVSFALGAFFAGMVMARSRFSAQAMKDVLPLRDAFAVLFFVSVGMIFDPSIVWRAPLALASTVLIVICVKSLVAYGIVRAFHHRGDVAVVIAAALAQIGEFSFIMIGMGVSLDIVPPEARDLVVAAALISILLNPLLFGWIARRRLAAAPGTAPVEAGPPETGSAQREGLAEG